MSWSVSSKGLNEKVAEDVSKQFDQAANIYKGTEEEKDVLSAKDRCLQLLRDLKPDEYANGVEVDCSGSRQGGFGGQFQVKVYRTRIVV